MNNILEVYNEYKNLGINTRKITQGKEFELVEKFIDYRKSIYKSKSKELAIFVEPKISNSYPDIVFVEYDLNAYEFWNDYRNLLNDDDYKILYYIFFKKKTISDNIVKDLGVNWKECTHSLEKLFDSNLIDRNNKKWKIANKNVFGVHKIQAIEAKLNKIDTVIQQALINKNFASESYILSNFKKDLNNEYLVKLNDFGLGMYNEKGSSFELITKSDIKKIPVSYYSIIFNEWIGKIISS